jgi:flavin reductase (DIM6/NTAB) family NADH-FMN oxidoreductase RutF
MSHPVSGQSFREALAHFASGVTVVAVRKGEQLVGLTATAFSSASLDPPLVLVCIARSASAHDAILDAERVGISVLAEDQGWIAKQFARRGIDRFDRVSLVPGRGAPLVRGALAHLECRHHAQHDAGDHTILVGEVVATRVAPGRPLVHYGRALGALAHGERAVDSAATVTQASDGGPR